MLTLLEKCTGQSRRFAQTWRDFAIIAPNRAKTTWPLLADVAYCKRVELQAWFNGCKERPFRSVCSKNARANRAVAKTWCDFAIIAQNRAQYIQPCACYFRFLDFENRFEGQPCSKFLYIRIFKTGSGRIWGLFVCLFGSNLARSATRHTKTKEIPARIYSLFEPAEFELDASEPRPRDAGLATSCFRNRENLESDENGNYFRRW